MNQLLTFPSRFAIGRPQVILKEDDIASLLSCSMADITPHPLQAKAFSLLRRSVLDSLFGDTVDPKALQRKLLRQWDKHWASGPKEAQYLVGKRTCMRFGRQLDRFLTEYRVVREFLPYRLKLPHGTIEGWAALVSRTDAKRRERTMVLSGELRQAKVSSGVDYLSLARWLALKESTGRSDLGLLRLPLLYGKPRENWEVDEDIARIWLDRLVMLSVLDGHAPRPGSYCRDCSHPCKQVYHTVKIPGWHD